ncbi:LSM domain-containing protein [Baffinella frigidus]|nr:LSM domain-containing protein [Cryptophyta sp. CCMP2293]|mmetsp:Transcript_67995/g.162377  ORF Transcript_67995/g.162377 Transcript_67995/m.162377 type:complete len:80 (-) Transcript_67995:439-678(-)
MSGKGGPDLKKYMDKKVTLKLNANRTVSGVLRGFDQFMNVVLDHTQEHVNQLEKKEIGMCVVRGNSISMMECHERAVFN